jgi:threonine/homoserine/homoserine lactone efflux protein
VTDLILPLVLFLFPLAYSPGPGKLFFAALGARFGLRATLPATVGYHLATWIVTVGIGLGFAGAAVGFPQAFLILGWLGSAYVFWLAIRFPRAGLIETATDVPPAGFRDGAVLLVLNPKAYAIIALIFSQFLTAGPATPKAVLAIATIFTLNNLLAFTLWTLGGQALASPGQARRLNLIFGTLLAAVALVMALR